jgi:hypothetical protein
MELAREKYIDEKYISVSFDGILINQWLLDSDKGNRKSFTGCRATD